MNNNNIFLYGIDLWNNAAKNEALANYYWAPLMFDESGGIKPLNCGESAGFIKKRKPLSAAGTDVNTGIEGFNIKNDITKDRQYAQSFKVKKSGTLYKIAITLFKNHYPDSGLIVELYKAGPGDLPEKRVIFSTNISPAIIGWAAKNVLINPSLYVKKGEKYTIVLRTNATTGSYGFAHTEAAVYTKGKVSVKEGEHGVFNILPSGSLKFQTFVRRAPY
ncbi:MAG: hypothetical protein EOP53_17700 [Sphingobacteriales bacterium]|nr:MAG: hypothetical protein EOP53_17700 [Sphingobacteriales bacterium]